MILTSFLLKLPNICLHAIFFSRYNRLLHATALEHRATLKLDDASWIVRTTFQNKNFEYPQAFLTETVVFNTQRVPSKLLNVLENSRVCRWYQQKKRDCNGRLVASVQSGVQVNGLSCNIAKTKLIMLI